MGDRVEVELASLTAFAKAANALAADHADGAQSHPANLKAKSGDMYESGAGFAEAYMFADYHNRLANSVTDMLKDTIAGMESLGSGAEYVAVNYANSDQRNAAAQRQVDGNDETTSVRMKGKTQLPANAVDDGLGPNQTNQYVPPGNSPEDVLLRKESIYNRQHLGSPPSASGSDD